MSKAEINKGLFLLHPCVSDKSLVVSLNSNPNQVPVAIISEMCLEEAMCGISPMLEPAVS